MSRKHILRRMLRSKSDEQMPHEAERVSRLIEKLDQAEVENAELVLTIKEQRRALQSVLALLRENEDRARQIINETLQKTKVFSE